MKEPGKNERKSSVVTQCRWGVGQKTETSYISGLKQTLFPLKALQHSPFSLTDKERIIGAEIFLGPRFVMAFKIIPANAVAFARFNLGNKITNALGIEVASQTDMNLSLLDEPAKDVLREAVANARKAGRNYVEYKPIRLSLQETRKIYRGKRSARNYFVLLESATDPVFEMFTSVGGFRFQDSPDSGFVIPNDPYDFDHPSLLKIS